MINKRPDLTEANLRSIKEKLCKFKHKERIKICELYKTKSATEIGKIYKVPPSTILTALKLENVCLRTRKQAQQLYLKLHNERSEKQSIFMKKHNPMLIEKNRKKCSQPKEKNAMWCGGKDIICKNCGKKRYLKPSAQKKLILNGLCWTCYKKLQPKSSLEIRMKKALEDNNINFKEQYSFKRYFLDFLLPEYRINIECDGIYWHQLTENKARDKRRDIILKKEGYKVLRFTDKEINNNIQQCINKILKTIGEMN